ncbi:hypothetical protein D3C81_1443750 [compost metagenome]
MRRIEGVDQQIQALARCQIETQPGRQRLTPRRAVVAPAIGAEVVGRHVVVHGRRLALELHAGADAVVAAVAGAQPPRIAVLAVSAPQLQHAPGGIAVQRRERPTQHVHPLGAHQVEVRQLALTVGHGRRNAIHQQPHAAHAKGGTRTKAADRQLRVLCIILPLTCQQAWHTAQRFGYQRTPAIAIGLHRGGGGGQVEISHRMHLGGLHLHRAQRGGHRLGSLRGHGQQQPGYREKAFTCSHRAMITETA